jgi:hypothetical protein
MKTLTDILRMNLSEAELKAVALTAYCNDAGDDKLLDTLSAEQKLFANNLFE